MGIIARLSQYNVVPVNGLIIYCGEIITRNDKTEFEYHCITPPSPVTSFSYVCNSRFEIEAAEQLITKTDTYALIVLDLHEACWGTISGTNLTVLGNIDSIVPSKHSQGGQSSQRFARLRDIAINEFYVKLGDRVSNSMVPINENLKGILVGGCGLTKDEFVKGDFLHHELRKKIIGTFDVGYTNEHGLHELVEASKEKLTGLQSVHEKDVFDSFLKQLAKNINKCAYGLVNVIDMATIGKTKQVIISSDQYNIINQITPISKDNNFEIIIISDRSESGKILNLAFGGVVAMLRYE